MTDVLKMLRGMPDLPKADMDETLEAMSKKGIFHINGISEEKLSLITDRISCAIFAGSVQPIYICIDSEGGYISPVWKLIGMIKQYAGPVVGIVWGQACSSALLLLQACAYRFAWRGANGLIHSVSREIDLKEHTDLDSVEHCIKDVRIATDELYEELARRSGTPLAEIRRLGKTDEPFALTGSTFIHDVVEHAPPFGELPKKWKAKIEADVRAAKMRVKSNRKAR